MEDKTVWIGMTDERVEGEWEWKSGATPSFDLSKSTHWAPEEPDNKTSQNCLCVRESTLHDCICDGIGRGMVCERRKEGKIVGNSK